MTLPSRFWADLCTRDFARLDPARTIAVLPVAATEQHGPHLPLSVDTVLADGIVAASLPHLRTLNPCVSSLLAFSFLFFYFFPACIPPRASFCHKECCA